MEPARGRVSNNQCCTHPERPRGHDSWPCPGLTNPVHTCFTVWEWAPLEAGERGGQRGAVVAWCGVSVSLQEQEESHMRNTYREPVSYRTVKRINAPYNSIHGHVLFTIYDTSFFKEAVVFKLWHFLCRLNSRSIPQWEQNTAACISYNEYDLHLSRMSDFQTAGYK